MKKLGSTCLCAALVLLCATAVARPHEGHGGTARATTQKSIDRDPAVLRAGAFTMWMAVRSDRVQRWLWEARYRNQHARMRCLSHQLSRLHAIERLARTNRRAIIAAVRSGGLTGEHMVRLVHLSDSSRARLTAASRCGKKLSKRVRMKTQYSVRVVRRPVLPAPKR